MPPRAALLDGLGGDARRRLVDAMREIEAILTPGPAVSFTAADPTSDEARTCLARYYAELDERFAGGFDVGLAQPTDAEDLVPPRGQMVLARRDGEVIGCGVLKVTGDGVADIKRMWLAPEGRGSGLGGRLLAELERRARDDFGLGRSGWRRTAPSSRRSPCTAGPATPSKKVAAFNDERYGDHWFVKEL